MTRFILFLWLLFFLAPAHSATSAINVERAYLTDPESSLDIETAAKASFIHFDNDLNLGFIEGAVWLRLDIAPAAKRSADDVAHFIDRLILRVGPYFLDRIELFEMIDGEWTRQISGDLHSSTSTICLDDVHCFVLNENAAYPSTVYLRVETQGMNFVQTSVMDSSTLVSAVAKRVSQISISLTVALVLFIFGLLLLFKYRSILLYLYCFFQASIIVFLCSTNGVLGHFFPAISGVILDALSHYLYSLRVFLTILIGWVILHPYQRSHFYKYFIVIFLIFSLISFALIATGSVNFALKLNIILFVLNPYFQFCGVLLAKNVSKKIRTILLSGYLIYIAVVTLGALIALGVQSPFGDASVLSRLVDWRLNGVGVSIFIFWVVVMEQASRENFKAGELIKLRFEAAQAKANEEKLKDRHTLIDILTHELKNPLGTIKFALASLRRNVINDDDLSRRFKHIDFCVSRMNALIEHVARSSKIDRFESFDQKEKILAADLVNELIDEYPEYKRFALSIHDDISFHTNREMLTVIFENLISNAYKYAHSAAKIKITIVSDLASLTMNHAIDLKLKNSFESTYFEISNAVGVYAAPEESRLFERYYRHPNAQDIPGIGIGLSLVHAAAQKIGASVHYLQENGMVIFTVRVPN